MIKSRLILIDINNDTMISTILMILIIITFFKKFQFLSSSIYFVWLRWDENRNS